MRMSNLSKHFNQNNYQVLMMIINTNKKQITFKIRFINKIAKQ